MKYRELLIGCGNSRDKRILPYPLAGLPYPPQYPNPITTWHSLTTLDVDPATGANIVWDLHYIPYEFALTNEYDEIHAYEVLEHVGRQGDFQFFFAQFGELWRILRPGGFLCATVPAYTSQWADPGVMTRVCPGSPKVSCILGRDELRSGVQSYASRHVHIRVARDQVRGVQWPRSSHVLATDPRSPVPGGAT